MAERLPGVAGGGEEKTRCVFPDSPSGAGHKELNKTKKINKSNQ
jgi:hypothetical protein